MEHILSLPSRGPVRIRKILQLVEPSLDHVRLPLTRPEASHPLQQPHLRCRAAPLTPVWTCAQRTVRTARLRLPLGDTEASHSPHALHGTGLLCQDSARGTPNLGHASLEEHSTIYASKHLNSSPWRHSHAHELQYILAETGHLPQPHWSHRRRKEVSEAFVG